MSSPVAITGASMITGVGLNIDSSGVAIRCALDNFQESRFIDSGGEPIIASEITLQEPWRGTQKLVELATMSIADCLSHSELSDLSHTPLFLCLPEKGFPGRSITEEDLFLEQIEEKLDVRFGTGSRILSHGHTAMSVAMRHARQKIVEAAAEQALICGVDSYLSEHTLKHHEELDRLLTSQNSNGFIPGEACATVVVGANTNEPGSKLLIRGIGYGMETAPIGSGQPLRADGLSAAMKAALAEADVPMHHIQYRLADMTGEHYYFKEASLALSRTLHTRVDEMDLLHLTDSIGEIGCASGVAMLAYQYYLTNNGLTKDGNVMLHFGDADGKRSSMIVESQGA